MSTAPIAPRVPPSYFSMVLGLAGLSGAWRRAEPVLPFAPDVARVLAWLAAAVWLVLAAFVLVTFARHRPRVAAWFADAGTAPFPSLIGVALMMTAVQWQPASAWAEHVFFAGVAISAVTLSVFVQRVTTRRPPLSAVTSAWYLPGVAGGLVTAIGASAFGHPTLAWAGFAVGVLAWLGVAPLLALRAWRGGAHLPVTPVAAIELAPPTVGGLAWFALRPGPPDVLAMVLFVGAALAALVLLTMIPRMRGTPVGPAWWAFSFPLAAWASVALVWRARAPLSGPAAFALPLLAVASAVIAALAMDTLTKLVRGRLLAPPPAAMPPRS